MTCSLMQNTKDILKNFGNQTAPQPKTTETFLKQNQISQNIFVCSTEESNARMNK